MRTLWLFLLLGGPVLGGGIDLDTPGTVKLSLRDAPAATVLEALASVAGLGTVIPPLANEQLTVHLNSVSVAEALDAIADVSGLVIEIRGRIMVVFTPGRAPRPEGGRLRFERAPVPPPTSDVP